MVRMAAILALGAMTAVAAAVTAPPALAGTEARAPAATALPDASLQRTDSADGIVLRIDGVVTEGLEHRFAQTLDALPPNRPLVVELDSPGGFTTPGYRMIDRMLAERAAGRPVATRVRGGESCESMCVGIYLAGYPRFADPSAEFMVHAPRMADTGSMTLRTTRDMVKRLVALGAAEGWIAQVRQAGGFSGKRDYRTSADRLTAEKANVVTVLTR